MATRNTQSNSLKNGMQNLLRLVSVALVMMMVMGLAWGQTEISDLSGITDAEGSYILSSSFSTTGTPSNNIGSTATNPFKGTIDGGLVTITGTWDKPLFNYVEDATIKNVIIGNANVNITTSSTNVGAIAGNALGATRIYNCGILDGSVRGTGYTGGLVGVLKGTARVINCYSYATITGGTTVGGIVGHNDVASSQSNIATMVMNCMFYGDITDGTTVSPVYGGQKISNENSGGLSTFNYYAYEKLRSKTIADANFKCALALEDKYLTRIEFYRLLLNSNRKLAAMYASTSSETVSTTDMAKWVLETADRTNTNPKPYPVLKSQGRYPSIINPDFDHAEQLTLVNGMPSEEDRNKGGKIGTLSVTIDGVGSGAPTGAALLDASGHEITGDHPQRVLSLVRTDKDVARFNFNYDKVQLPYYNDYGTKNYTGNKVVTGWMITDITPVANDPYNADNYKTSGEGAYPQDYPNFNFADRKSSNKDLYSISGRVFSQGAYFDVPYGVTSITIKPYWGQAAYVADEYMDVVYKSGKVSNRFTYIPEIVTQLPKHFPDGKITIDGSEQTVHTSISNALNTLNGSTVYDNAVVLVGNLHQIGVPSAGDKAFTMMSVDLNKDNEPDCSFIYADNDRHTVSPLRFDFLNVPGAAQAQKPSGSDIVLNPAIFRTKGWFEITNTALMYFCQYEYENQGTGDNVTVTKAYAPLILLGGYIDQFVSTQSTRVDGKTYFIHVGSNVLINSFGLGTHSDGSKATPHVPVSVTGGEYLGFYLSGTYNQNATVSNTNAECYISGGHFIEAAGASQEQIGGDMHWQINYADIDDFYGGGTNAAKPITGHVTVDIYNSHVSTYCGGPKFGDMQSGKKVTTNAERCTFGKYFGAGYGGLSYSRKKYFDATSYNFTDLQKYYYCPTSPGNHQNERGKYYNGTSSNCPNANYGKKGPGVATDFDYEFFVWTSGQTGVRFYINFATFSLAQCNDVKSTLKNCIINENFYGGGSLGKVKGNVTSELDGCTVRGNVFGAGYSATMPKIEVRDQGFMPSGTTYLFPKFNKYSGLFEDGTLSGTTTFKWKNGTFPSNGTLDPSFAEGKVTTDVNLDKSNLGSVSGNVELTLKGNTTVGTEGDEDTGNVYGGGDESYVTQQENNQHQPIANTGNTTVILEDGTQVLGNVYGGGNNGPVKGDSKVIIQEGTNNTNNTTTEP